MQRHTDYGFLPKTQPDLNPAVHVSPYQRTKYNVTRIIVPFRIVDITSGPDLNHTYSYTSIIRLGLAAGDTPDAPYNRLGTRGPSSTRQTPNYSTQLRRQQGGSQSNPQLPDVPELLDVMVFARRLR
ncbi:hypothetical protein F511_19146 [Dorcoceras hygrometricum]|uniref:Uncharacterized protein n=1 Tax=Dorcoceras hygrometricum TaxID=472368 RepID=A0A2Z7BDJ7_9LAMI|nr:hypothetical protein F511_19146 [Dorcoceras hygrometricum]